MFAQRFSSRFHPLNKHPQNNINIEKFEPDSTIHSSKNPQG
jgi:hypothetical protein